MKKIYISALNDTVEFITTNIGALNQRRKKQEGKKEKKKNLKLKYHKNYITIN